MRFKSLRCNACAFVGMFLWALVTEHSVSFGATTAGQICRPEIDPLRGEIVTKQRECKRLYVEYENCGSSRCSNSLMRQFFKCNAETANMQSTMRRAKRECERRVTKADRFVRTALIEKAFGRNGTTLAKTLENLQAIEAAVNPKSSMMKKLDAIQTLAQAANPFLIRNGGHPTLQGLLSARLSAEAHGQLRGIAKEVSAQYRHANSEFSKMYDQFYRKNPQHYERHYKSWLKKRRNERITKENNTRFWNNVLNGIVRGVDAYNRKNQPGKRTYRGGRSCPRSQVCTVK